jgi:hypothetical protein
MRVVALILSPIVGVVCLWLAYTGKPIYGQLSSGPLRTPMPRREGRVIAAIVGIGFLLLFVLALFTK